MNSGQYLKDVKAQIRETDVEAVRKAVEARQGKAGDGNGAGPVLIDVREKDEWTEGYIPGARWISRGFLEQRIEDQVPERSSEIVLYCAGGTRSALAAQDAGRARLHQRQVDGGRVLGLEARRAEVRPAVRHDARSRACATRATPCCPRSARRGRRSCCSRRCCASARAGSARRPGLYLAAAGVGTVGFVDDDVVDASNLQRQILHATDRVGMPKVESAKVAIAKLNPDVKVIGHQTRLDVGERARHHQGLRRHRRRRGQLPDALPAQRRGAEAGQAGDRRQHLPLRGDGDDVPAVRGPLLPLLLSASRRRPTWRRRARRRACSACCAA